ncbi:unnamed protein product [Phytophthora fragariaefolia]|uniref:Unnamed protein product n=1 Tax=Phytophthora fragariaefolia TaxID=1490495 RepID=A0A9W6XN62_9STRA|nr:unnamed protein product [Phytophthora fragariaefolia]
MKALRSDNANEFQHLQNTCESKYGMEFGGGVKHTPDQNGVEERMIRTITEKMRCMLLHFDLPEPMWGEAALTVSIICRVLLEERRCPMRSGIARYQHMRSCGLLAVPPSHMWTKLRGARWKPRQKKLFLLYTPERNVAIACWIVKPTKAFSVTELFFMRLKLVASSLGQIQLTKSLYQTILERLLTKTIFHLYSMKCVSATVVGTIAGWGRSTLVNQRRDGSGRCTAPTVTTNPLDNQRRDGGARCAAPTQISHDNQRRNGSGRCTAPTVQTQVNNEPAGDRAPKPSEIVTIGPESSTSLSGGGSNSERLHGSECRSLREYEPPEGASAGNHPVTRSDRLSKPPAWLGDYVYTAYEKTNPDETVSSSSVERPKDRKGLQRVMAREVALAWWQDYNCLTMSAITEPDTYDDVMQSEHVMQW